LSAEILDQTNEPAEENSEEKGADKCPRCEGNFLRRRRRSGFLQKRIFAALGYYPWRCSRCGGNFLLKMRGLPLRRRLNESAAQQPAE